MATAKKKDGKPQYPETPSQGLSPGYAAQTSEGNPRPRVGALGPAILTRCKTSLIADWLARTKKTPELNHLRLSADERTGHLPKLIDDLVVRLGRPKLPDKDSDAIASPAAIEHGRLRRKQGYSSGMLIHESRILQVTIFGKLHANLSMLDFNLLLPDVMIIADEVDAQLTQTMGAFAKVETKKGGSLKVVHS